VLCAAACRRQAETPQAPLVAQISGVIAVSGLHAPVRVVRDTWGVPHIYAANQDDLFAAQGFVQAQDRLFQMDLWRRSAQGRLSEVLGPNFIERDAMTRRVQYRGDLSEEWASYGPDAKAIADAFVRGINAWVALARERPPEEFVLAGWKPEPWAAEDLLNRTDAFLASGDALDEVFRARLVAAVGLPRARLLLGDEGDRSFEVPPGIDPAAIPPLVADMIRRVGTPPFFLGLAAPVSEGTVRSQTDTSEPVIALAHPSRRYFVHLIAPGWDVIGAAAPWLPGVVAGHNERIGFTAQPLSADTQDVYVEKLNPANPRQVEDNGQWVDIETATDYIAVRGRKAPVSFTRETTRHGIIVASDLERHLAFSIRWSGTEPGAAGEMAAASLDRAADLAGFQSALARWKFPTQTFTYVDAAGSHPGLNAALVPVRHGRDGSLPAPGWSRAFEWDGWMRASSLRPAGPPTGQLLAGLRQHPDRAEELLKRLVSLGSNAESLKLQRGAIVDAFAESLGDREPRGQDHAVLFSHPLAVTPAARRRFNVAVRRGGDGGVTDPLAIALDPRDWDRSSAIDAPGQSGSPESQHFADLAALWSGGKMFPLAFSEQAVQAHAAATLTLTPK
jgi:penicillin amidase